MCRRHQVMSRYDILTSQIFVTWHVVMMSSHDGGISHYSCEGCWREPPTFVFGEVSKAFALLNDSLYSLCACLQRLKGEHDLFFFSAIASRSSFLRSLAISVVSAAASMSLVASEKWVLSVTEKSRKAYVNKKQWITRRRVFRIH